MEDTESRAPEPCFCRSVSSLTVHDVYEIAKLVGAEVEALIDGYGRDSVRGLVPRVVKVLELLESFAARNDDHRQREEELLKTFRSITLQQHKKRPGPGGPGPGADPAGREGDGGHDAQELQQWRRRCEELQLQVQQLQEDRQELQRRLKGNNVQDDRLQRQEREVMLKLKEVVDKQRDELRAKVQQISITSKEVEALQEQLDRFMKMNSELRHKQNVLQAQLSSTVERRADLEADLKEKTKEIENLQRAVDTTNKDNLSNATQTAEELKMSSGQKDPDQPCFTKKEVRDILFERNELKTNLFLVQEELNYYQREILSEDRCPGFLLEAVRSTIKKRRKLIKAKMLGIPSSQCSSSDEEDRTSPFKQTPVECTEVDGSVKPAESRIRNFFSFLSRSGGGRSPAHMTGSASAWEIIDDSEADGEAEPRLSP